MSRYVHHDSRRALNATAAIMRWRYAGRGDLTEQLVFTSLGSGWMDSRHLHAPLGRARKSPAYIQPWEEMA